MCHAVRQMKLSDFREAYGVGKTKSYELVHIEGFPAIKMGRLWYVKIAEFEKWQEKHGNLLN